MRAYAGVVEDLYKKSTRFSSKKLATRSGHPRALELIVTSLGLLLRNVETLSDRMSNVCFGPRQGVGRASRELLLAKGSGKSRDRSDLVILLTALKIGPRGHGLSNGAATLEENPLQGSDSHARRSEAAGDAVTPSILRL